MPNNLNLHIAEIAGRGRAQAPAGGAVPDVGPGDMHRDPSADYHRVNEIVNEEFSDAGEIAKAWIRRAYLAESFAKALEAELEKLRRAQQCNDRAKSSS